VEAKELTKVRRLPAEKERVEDGPIMFGDDWPGTFIRGDNSFLFAVNLRRVLAQCQIDHMTRSILASLMSILESTDCRNNDAFPSWHEKE
jgi:hypothetical protein